ncbi:restriction endonuclease [Rubneribacter badeniensis]|uniref:Restriction endonuclease n=1 Tax=Rubneribacter badeniensis TaxID=2070688 RepID=A0A2K2U814_9ACTN|nr:restriction endonuclease subunit S [Rubneribacter badeniensis]PNV66409.1 restriction endonuclease [Rubneribacter badeniensis]
MNRVKLGDIADIQLGKMLDAKKNKGEYHPYLANIHVRWGEFDVSDLPSMRFEEAEKGRFSLRNGDLIMCEGGEPGRCAIWRNQLPNVYYQKALHRIRPHKDIVDVRWLYYWFLLQGRIGGLKKHFVETTIKHLVGEDLKCVEIDLPSLELQNAVADALSAIDDKIALNKRMMSELEETARLIYDYWFTQFDFPDENGNPYRSSGGKMTYSKTLNREIPAGWRVANLSMLVDEISDSTDTINMPKNWRYTPIDDIPKRTMVLFGGRHSESASTSLQLYRENDILIGAMRVYFHRVCIAAQNGITRSTSIVLRPKNFTWHGYIYETLNDDRCIAYATKASVGTQQPYVTWDGGLSNYEIPLPPDHLICKYSSFAQPTIQKAKSLAKESFELESLRNWLLPMLMNGQVSIQSEA